MRHQLHHFKITQVRFLWAAELAPVFINIPVIRVDKKLFYDINPGSHAIKRERFKKAVFGAKSKDLDIFIFVGGNEAALIAVKQVRSELTEKVQDIVTGFKKPVPCDKPAFPGKYISRVAPVFRRNV